MPLGLPSDVSPESTEQPDGKITKPVVLLVEGRDEEEFFEALLADMGIKDYQVRAVGGKTKSHVDFRAFLNDPGFFRVKAYAILRDTDTDAGALTSIRDLLIRHNQPCPGRSGGIEEGSNRKVGIYLMPGAGRQGMTEDLCLEAVRNHPFMECVDRFLACVERTASTKQGRALQLIPQGISQRRGCRRFWRRCQDRYPISGSRRGRGTGRWAHQPSRRFGSS